MKTIPILVAAVLSIALTGALSFAQVVDSCGGGCPKPPSNSRAVAAQAVPLATYPGNTLSATLAKGKKKTILMADGMLTEGPFVDPVSREYDLGISVNGLSMHPSVAGPGTPEADEDCGVLRSDPDRTCTVIGHWWLDMDDPANAALLGVPITVTLVGGDPSGGPAVGSLVDVSLRVRLEKK
jgi:hypothetical protein